MQVLRTEFDTYNTLVSLISSLFMNVQFYDPKLQNLVDHYLRVRIEVSPRVVVKAGKVHQEGTMMQVLVKSNLIDFNELTENVEVNGDDEISITYTVNFVITHEFWNMFSEKSNFVMINPFVNFELIVCNILDYEGGSEWIINISEEKRESIMDPSDEDFSKRIMKNVADYLGIEKNNYYFEQDETELMTVSVFL